MTRVRDDNAAFLKRALALADEDIDGAPIEEDVTAERLARILDTAERVLGSREAALSWLGRPLQVGLGGSAPIDCLLSDRGARVIEDLLVQAEYGLTA